MATRLVPCPACDAVVSLNLVAAERWDEDAFELLGRTVKFDPVELYAHLWLHEAEVA